jgi:hypothetical protein
MNLTSLWYIMIRILSFKFTLIKIASATIWHYYLEAVFICTDTDYVIIPVQIIFRTDFILSLYFYTIVCLIKVVTLVFMFLPIFCISTRLLFPILRFIQMKSSKVRYTLFACTFLKIVSASLTDLSGPVLNKSTIKTLSYLHNSYTIWFTSLEFDEYFFFHTVKDKQKFLYTLLALKKNNPFVFFAF